MNKLPKLWSIVACLSIGAVGCADNLDGILRTSGSESGPSCRVGVDGKRWDLGTGRLDDIKRLAPGFFTASNGSARRAALLDHINGVSEIRPASLDGAEVFEFLTNDSDYRIRAVHVGEKVAILATPGQCPRVTAVDQCANGRLKTEIQVGAPVSCLGPITVPADKVTITMGSNEYLREELVFDKPLLETTSSNSISFAVHLSGGKEPAANVERRVDDFSRALPREVISFLRAGYERPAAMLWRNVPTELKTDETSANVASARSDAIAVAISAAATPRAINDLVMSHPFGSLPGDQDVRAAIVNKVNSLVSELVAADPAPETLFTIALYARVVAPLSAEKLDVSALEEKYGPLLRKAGYADDKVQGSFMVLLPDSKYTRDLAAQEEKENAIAANSAKQRAADSAVEENWSEVQGRADEVATLAYKIRFGRENFVQSRHNTRGLEAMEKYRQGLIRDAFCPAKRAFLKATGAAEYNRRAAEHCTNEPPVEAGIGGAEKKLWAECRVAFATGC